MYFWLGEISATCGLGCQLPFWEEHGNKGNIEMCFLLSAEKKHHGQESRQGREGGSMVWNLKWGSQLEVGELLEPDPEALVGSGALMIKTGPPCYRQGKRVGARPLTHSALLSSKHHRF